MKKILPIILALILLASPVAADIPYKLIVDNELVDKPVVIIDGTAYVPIRAVADTFNATTDWNAATKTINIKTKPDVKEIKRPPINGDAEFISKINAALDLLEQKDFPHYVMVCQNTFDIAQLNKVPNGLPENALAFNMFGATRILPFLMNDPKRYTAVYLAGILVHEACHATTNKYHKPITEKDAYAHGLTVFRLLDAPYWMQDECIGRDNE